jgi:hypothetical protein
MKKKNEVKKSNTNRSGVVYVEHSKTDIEEALNAAAFLLEFAGEDAGGIAGALRTCAQRVSLLYTQDEVRKCGGDPSILWGKGAKR